MTKLRGIVFGFTLSLCLVGMVEAPIRAQESSEAQEETTVGIKDVEEGALSTATTTQDLQIPKDELRLLVKPLFLSELQVEADSWLLLLKNTVEEISSLEVTIKRQNESIAKQEEALKSLESARTTLEEAKAEQESASQGTPEYEEATQKVEAAQENLKEAQTALREAAAAKQGIEEDETLAESLERAAETQELDAAKTALTEAEKAREELEAGSETYEQATQEINTLETAIAQFEEAQETLSGINPEAEEYPLAVRNLEKAKQDLIDVREELEGSGMVAELATAQRLLDGAQAKQENLTPGTEEDQNTTAQIETLESAIAEFQEARKARREADLEEAAAYDQAVQTLNKAEQDLLDAIEQVQGTGAAKELTLAQETLTTAKTNLEALDPETQTYQQANERIQALESAIAQFEETREARQQADPNAEDYEEIAKTADQARQGLEEARQAIVLDNSAGESEENSAQAAQDQQQEIQAAVQTLQESLEAESEQKNQLVVTVTDLQAERTGIIDRLAVVLDELERKGGEVKPYRAYIQAVSGVEIDITDTEGLGVRLLTWLTSEEGGLRWLIKGGIFIGIIAGSLLASFIAGAVVNGGLSKFENISETLRMLVVRSIRLGIIAFGSLYALTVWGFSLGPILALVGGASFVLAFALQSNLGNVASGLMLMAYKPLDVGDKVLIPGTTEKATVTAITLANTTFTHYSGKIVTMQNSDVWGSKIERIWSDGTRIIEFYFLINSTDDGQKISEIWNRLTSEHPKVLKDKWIMDGPILPQSGQFMWWCVAFANKGDYWPTQCEILIGMRNALKEAGISFGIQKEEHYVHLLADYTKPEATNGQHYTHHSGDQTEVMVDDPDVGN